MIYFHKHYQWIRFGRDFSRGRPRNVRACSRATHSRTIATTHVNLKIQINHFYVYFWRKNRYGLNNYIFIYGIILDINYLLAPCTSSMKINEVGRAWFFITMRNHYTIVIKNVISSLLLKKFLTLSNGIDTRLRVGLMFYSQKVWLIISPR